MYAGLHYGGWWAYSTAIFLYGFVPIVELLSKQDPKNITKYEEELRKDDPVYDYFLYFYIPLVYYAHITYFKVM